jgi:TonB-dependent receptor
LAALAIIPLLFASAGAQGVATGSIEGRVVNQASGSYLENARLTIEGTPFVTLTDDAGFYRFTNVPVGVVKIRAFFTGLEVQTQNVTVGAGQTVRQDISLATFEGTPEKEGGPIRLSKYVVSESQQMEGAAIAINEQRFAPNFKTVVSADEFGAASESDVGEFLKYLPGVQMGYNSGEARQVSIGGTDFNYTPVTFGGFAMTNSNQNGTNRGVSLESIALNNISRIEIINTPTPESPGAALAGSVNFVPRSAFERSKPQFTFSTYVQMRDDLRDFHKSVGGREQRTRKVLPGVEFSYVVPVNKNFGFSLSGTAFKAWSERDSMVNTWRGGNAATDGNAFPDTTPDRPYLSTYQLRDGWLLRKRSSISLTLDYRLTPNDRISLSATRTSYNTNYDTRGLTFTISRVASFGSDFTHGATGAGTLGVSSPDGTRDRSITNYMPTFVYRHDGPIWKAEAGAGYGHSKDHTAAGDRGWFAITALTRPNVTINFDGFDMLRPGKITVADGATGRPIDPFDINNYTITTTNTPEPKGSDAKGSVYANLRRDFKLGATPLGLKGGVDLQRQIRDTANPYPANTNFTYLGPDGRANSGDEAAAPFFFSEIATRPGAFGFPAIPTVNNTKLWAFYQANPNAFRLDESAAYANAVSVSRHAEEVITSAFVRGDVSFFQHRLKLVGGLRAEQTNIKAQGPLVDPTLNFQRDASGKVILGANGRPVPITSDPLAAAKLTNVFLGTHVKKEYLRWFPSINASYNLRDNLIARAAWHTSIGRPNFVQYSGAITLPDVENATPTSRIVLNNAAIKPWSAHTTTLALEYYFARVGTVSVTVHRREFENFFGTSLIPATPEFLALYDLDPAVYGGFLISTQRNLGTTVRMDGLEFNYKQALTFLPQWARGVQVFANASTQHTTGASRDQFQNSPSLLNGGVSLTRRNYSLRVDANHRGRQFQNTINGRGIQNDTKSFEKARTYIDITGEHVLWRQLRLFAKLRNVTDEGVDVDIYGPLTPPYARFQQRQRYGSLWTFGVKGIF